MARTPVWLVVALAVTACPSPSTSDATDVTDGTDTTGVTDTTDTTGPTATTATTGDTGKTTPPTYALEVTVTGLLGAGLVLHNNGGDDLAVAADGTHTFSTELSDGAAFDVTVASDPLGPPQRCKVTDGMGTAGPKLAPVAVTCETFHVAFLTSSTGRGDLGAWKDAGGNTGLAAGDAICQAHADRAGLPGTFVAWLSDGTDDGYCRIAGHAGKMTANCGQTKLPTGAGPWVRTDGQAFASALERMVAPTTEVLAPVRYDESGADVGDTMFYSATSEFGDAHRDDPCQGWTSEANTGESVSGGSSTQVDLAHWGSASCAFDLPLLGLQTGAGIDLPDPPPPPKDAHRIFLSSQLVNGDVGGLAGADAACASLATKAGYTGTWEAWLSDSKTSATSRMAHTGAWVRPDGRVVAASKKDLLAGMLIVPPNQTELGTFSLDYAWTGSTSAGEARAETCGDWSASTSDVTGGRALPYAAHSAWSEWGTYPCNGALHLYCYED